MASVWKRGTAGTSGASGTPFTTPCEGRRVLRGARAPSCAAPTPTPRPRPHPRRARAHTQRSLVAVQVMEKHNVPTLERMLEFIYTNRVEALKECSAHEVLDLLSAAEEYLLPDLKKVSCAVSRRAVPCRAIACRAITCRAMQCRALRTSEYIRMPLLTRWVGGWGG